MNYLNINQPIQNSTLLVVDFPATSHTSDSINCLDLFIPTEAA